MSHSRQMKLPRKPSYKFKVQNSCMRRQNVRAEIRHLDKSIDYGSTQIFAQEIQQWPFMKVAE